jgi:hypothetical protein
MAGHTAISAVDCELYGDAAAFKHGVDLTKLAAAVRPNRVVLGGFKVAVPSGLSVRLVAPTTEVLALEIAERQTWPVYYLSANRLNGDYGWRLRRLEEDSPPGTLAQVCVQTDPLPMGHPEVRCFTPEEVARLAARGLNLLIWPMDPVEGRGAKEIARRFATECDRIAEENRATTR